MLSSIQNIPTSLDILEARVNDLEFLCAASSGSKNSSKDAATISLSDTIVHNVGVLADQTASVVRQHDVVSGLVRSLSGK